MNANAMRKNSESTLARIDNAGSAKSFSEAMALAAQKLDAERGLELCTIFESMTDEEKTLLASIPTHQSDLRVAREIKVKYNVSWTELDILRKMAW